MDISELAICRNLEYQELFEKMVCLMGYASREEEPDALRCGGRLAELVVGYGFEGNLQHYFLAFCLASDENVYTTTYEIAGAAGGPLDELAREGFGIFKALFDYDILKLESSGMRRQSFAHRLAGKGNRVSNKRIRDRIVNPAIQLEESRDVKEFQSHVTEFYREFGVGKFGLNKAFRIAERNGGQTVLIDPIISVERVYPKDIVEYELQE